jgi:hypothetical protein
MEDRRAHERITVLEQDLKRHEEEHRKFEASLTQIAENTAEIVELVRGAKGLRTLIVWATPLAVAVAALVAWLRS